MGKLKKGINKFFGRDIFKEKDHKVEVETKRATYEDIDKFYDEIYDENSDFIIFRNVTNILEVIAEYYLYSKKSKKMIAKSIDMVMSLVNNQYISMVFNLYGFNLSGFNSPLLAA